MRSVVAVALLVILLGGCVQSKPPTGPTTGPVPRLDPDWAAKALPSDEGGHNHRDWKDHVGLSTPNFIELAHDPLGIAAFGNKTAGGYFCGGQATTAEGRRLTVINSFDTNVAFVVVDTTDPLHPRHLGDYLLDYAQTYDVDMTPDGRHVVIAADLSTGKQPDPPFVTTHLSFRDACTGEVHRGPDQTYAAGPSTVLVSIADPKNPLFEDVSPAPVLGPHSVSTALINGVTYVASSITNLAHHASYFEFFQLQSSPAGTKLLPLSTVDSGQYGQPTAVVNGHVDAEIAMHPVTNKPVVYLSNWGGGLVVLDFSNPRAPLRLGEWHDAGPNGGGLHSTRSIEGVHNGRHFELAGQEFTSHPSNRPSGWIYILDDTDPANIKEVGRWTLPVDVQKNWNNVELFSTHYFRVLDQTVFAAMYHGGVWAFRLDLDHPENMKAPPSVGVFLPDHEAQQGREPKGMYDLAPFVLDVFPFADGHLVVYDALTGVYSVKYDAAHPMPAPKPWPTS
jgi:hypothetical protein